jgi:phosphoribosylamine--glycine ligase
VQLAEKMRVLVLGGGGREHALSARLALDPDVSVLCAPGNPGIAQIADVLPVELDDVVAIEELAARNAVDLTVVGPELPLSVGVVDRFRQSGRLIVGPTEAAARLETSKAFAKAFMARHDIPTARFHISESAADALSVIRGGAFGFPVVLKADGLAAGKGVVIAADQADAEAAVAAAMLDRRFGAAGERIVIEECLEGPEVSFFVLADGSRTVPLGTAQDHKRIFDDDQGPNTGGMGAFAPSPLVDSLLHARIMREVVDPVMAGMAAEGMPFSGFLYVGLMLTAAGPRVIEFNVRLGDPEAQVLLPRIGRPLAPLLSAAARGALEGETCPLTDDVVVGVVMASRGYPASSESGKPITGIADSEHLGALVRHAGTAERDGAIVTAGGRVLTVVAQGQDFADAIEKAYAAVRAITFDGMQYRHDIGRKALQAQAP